MVSNSDFIFVSVPTPSNPDGSVNIDNINDVLKSINSTIDRDNPIILVRSTVVPGTTLSMSNNFPNLNIVFNPEFLTERSANMDFISQTRIVLGGPDDIVSKVSELYKSRFGSSMPIIKTDYQTAELIKYMNNTFFATKVSFMNEMFKVAQSIDANWDDAIEGFIRDGRVGHSHTQVPGPDNKLGFGGSCFPKDTRAFLHFAESLNINLNVLKGAWETNLEVRPERDWEKLKGRSIV